MSSIQGFILAGGQSRRMGTDKSHLTVNGQTFLERIGAEVSTLASPVSVVGVDTLNSRFKYDVVADVYPKWGALGGVHAALSNCVTDWALVVACDFPFVTRELFARLAAGRESFEAVAPIQSDLVPQPLCGLYRVIPCLQRSEELIKAGERKPVALLQSVRTRWFPFSEVADLEGSAHFFDNINTPQDYARIAAKGV